MAWLLWVALATWPVSQYGQRALLKPQAHTPYRRAISAVERGPKARAESGLRSAPPTTHPRSVLGLLLSLYAKLSAVHAFPLPPPRHVQISERIRGRTHELAPQGLRDDAGAAWPSQRRRAASAGCVPQHSTLVVPPVQIDRAYSRGNLGEKVAVRNPGAWEGRRAYAPRAGAELISPPRLSCLSVPLSRSSTRSASPC